MPFCGADEEAGDEEERWADNFAAFVTSTYAGLQSRAAEKCGVLPGEAWRTAMEAAAMAGARQVRGSCRPAPCMRPRCVCWHLCPCSSRRRGTLRQAPVLHIAKLMP